MKGGLRNFLGDGYMDVLFMSRFIKLRSGVQSKTSDGGAKMTPIQGLSKIKV